MPEGCTYAASICACVFGWLVSIIINKHIYFSIKFVCSDWEVGVVPGLGMTQGLTDNYPSNSFVAMSGVSTVDSEYIPVFCCTRSGWVVKS